MTGAAGKEHTDDHMGFGEHKRVRVTSLTKLNVTLWTDRVFVRGMGYGVTVFNFMPENGSVKDILFPSVIPRPLPVNEQRAEPLTISLFEGLDISEKVLQLAQGTGHSGESFGRTSAANRLGVAPNSLNLTHSSFSSIARIVSFRDVVFSLTAIRLRVLDLKLRSHIVVWRDPFLTPHSEPLEPLDGGTVRPGLARVYVVKASE
ncbi:hypothetical protein N7537_003455 [Penicillium hordei]|uniref:Uncharacterized protein n=1 Tax=Penicillium hordei TaxID=40994 RepID=A0AAD6H409_9EURO|nr:uncharacterized protein N7537_003455 [Penicillium hordei]KAJ5606836.1 hypothetical protein N7537_003455 [Penicillium hordei]